MKRRILYIGIISILIILLVFSYTIFLNVTAKEQIINSESLNSKEEYIQISNNISKCLRQKLLLSKKSRRELEEALLNAYARSEQTEEFLSLYQ